MKREEVLKRKLDNIEKKGQRALETAKIFLELNGNVSDIELAKKLNEMGIETSSSTVGRDLMKNLEEYYLFMNNKNEGINTLNEEQQRVVSFIKEKRNINKYEGKVKGGNNSFKNNEIIRDDNNHFRGSKPRRRG